jgi:ribosomal protein L7Ae-like RNA K-turn-binding protein
LQIPLSQIFPDLIFGLNQITRKLERGNEISLVILCRDAPGIISNRNVMYRFPLTSHLVQHIPILCFRTHVPLCVLSESCLQLGNLFKSKSLLCIAFKVSLISYLDALSALQKKVEDRNLELTRDAISFQLPKFDIPWIQSDIDKSIQIPLLPLKVQTVGQKRTKTENANPNQTTPEISKKTKVTSPATPRNTPSKKPGNKS